MEELHYIDIPVKGNHKYTHIRLDCYYDKGNSEIAGHERKRGYYLSVAPIERCDRPNFYTYAYCPSESARLLLLEVKRKSCRQGEAAEVMAVSAMKNAVQWACDMFNLELTIDLEQWMHENDGSWFKMEQYRF